ncbi:hypothetical protein F0L17_14355 [Streptomyces sp. TRM43335]|uniref:Minor tail protein n=1 Tax=Streptomyces taklimakanensis TaxID=2569853 RepID=A0A6G2BDW3_9ACTN|nr:hypothetical protein [Streptomyces taklimakanensis]MTE20269.1 hypothetical protein [Streptomyces taklimakanensis]
MLSDYIAIGSNEVANTARLAAYLESMGSPLTSGSDICTCATLTADVLDQPEYTTADDPDSPAPWYDPDIPESGDFLGFLPLAVEGVDDYPVTRTVTNAVVGGGAIGPARARPRTITVSGILLGLTCCSVGYGLHWLAETLQGCTGAGCGGDCMTLYTCCPGEDMTAEEFNDRYRRTYRRVSLVSGPTVTGRVGSGDCQAGRCASGADIVTVEFTLVAATPWPWTDTIPLMDVALPLDDSDACITWCVSGSSDPACAGPCPHAECFDPESPCADPGCAPPAPPSPALPETCFCLPLAVERDCYDLDLSDRPQWSTDVPMITVRAGANELRGVTVAFYEKAGALEGLPCDQVADINRCGPHSEYTIDYVPPGGVVTIDGQVGRAVLECGGECRTAPNVFGRDGAPPSFRPLDCASYCVCISSSAIDPPGPDATVSIGVSGRGY